MNEQEKAKQWEFVPGGVCDPAYEEDAFVNAPEANGSVHIPNKEQALELVNAHNALLAVLSEKEAELAELNGRIAEMQPELGKLRSEVERLTAELKELREETKASEVERSRNADRFGREGY